MRLMWAKVRPGTWESYESKYRDVAKEPVAGRRAQWLARDAKDPDALYVVSLWDEASDIRVWENTNHYVNVYVPTLRPFIEGEYSVSVCDVRDHQGMAGSR